MNLQNPNDYDASHGDDEEYHIPEYWPPEIKAKVEQLTYEERQLLKIDLFADVQWHITEPFQSPISKDMFLRTFDNMEDFLADYMVDSIKASLIDAITKNKPAILDKIFSAPLMSIMLNTIYCVKQNPDIMEKFWSIVEIMMASSEVDREEYSHAMDSSRMFLAFNSMFDMVPYDYDVDRIYDLRVKMTETLDN